jgi:hypothetical protein
VCSQSPIALAQVAIPGQGFKVPDARQVLNRGLREFDRLFAELVDAMAKRASKSTINAIRLEILQLNADLRTIGRLLGMLSPWQPRANTYAGGAAAKEGDVLTLADKKADKKKVYQTEQGLQYVRHRDSSPSDVLVFVSPEAIDAAFARSLSYIAPGDAGIGDRRQRFKEFLKQGTAVQASRVRIQAGGKIVDFADGRHRYAVQREAGAKQVAVMVPRSQLKQFQELFGASVPQPSPKVAAITPKATAVVLESDESKARYPWIDKAVQFLESKRVVTGSQFKQLQQADKRAVFTAPGIESTATLKAIQQKLAKSVQAGDDLRAFRKSIEAEVALSRAQTETLYRTETKRGFVAGLDTSLASPIVRSEYPAVLFSSTPDTRVRDEHWEIDGFVCLRTDPAYKYLIAALDDWNCRCALIPISYEEAERRGIKTYKDLPADVIAKYRNAV